MSKTLGEYTPYADLTLAEQELIQLAWKGANSSADNKLCFHSDFPVGAGILAANAKGETKQFCGCNVENEFFPATICAERNAATTAAVEGYTKFLAVAVLCRKYPGGSPCGLCRQVLNQFGRQAILLNIVDHNSNVLRGTVAELLPVARGKATPFDQLGADEQSLIRRLRKLKSRSHVPYSKRPRAALFTASNDNGHQRLFPGVPDDNASYGGSALAETVAMRAARTAGYTRKVKLAVTVENPTGVNPIDGESLQILREFGADASILLIGEDQSLVRTALTELLPDAFGPEAL